MDIQDRCLYCNLVMNSVKNSPIHMACGHTICQECRLLYSVKTTDDNLDVEMLMCTDCGEEV